MSVVVPPKKPKLIFVQNKMRNIGRDIVFDLWGRVPIFNKYFSSVDQPVFCQDYFLARFHTYYLRSTYMVIFPKLDGIFFLYMAQSMKSSS